MEMRDLILTQNAWTIAQTSFKPLGFYSETALRVLQAHFQAHFSKFKTISN